MPSDLIADLRGIHALDGMPDELLEELSRAARDVDLPAGSVIFRQGDPAQAAYLLVSGQVALEICTAGEGCKRILTVAGGELLGWSPALGQQQMTATARALSDVRAIELDGTRLLAACEHNPRLGFEFMKRTALALAKRLSATRLQLLNLYGPEMAPVADERASVLATSTQP
jgi:CRP-like cAMP-binding protein